MRSFDEILAISAERKGGRAAVLDDIDAPKTPAKLAATPNDRWLAMMARCVFQAGFNWKVVESMWPGFETAFRGFDVAKIAMMDDRWFDELVTDTNIVRHGTKIRSVMENANFILRHSEGNRQFGHKIAEWPGENFSGLLEFLKMDGSRLGGSTGQYFLRSMGKDSYILSRDVVARLIAEGVVDKNPTSKAAMRNVQAAFNSWAEESGQPLKVISRVLATSVG